jgi:N-acetylglutamate synthase-like GNAT family acetyltransferase
METEWINSPVEKNKARQIEKFFLEIFGYCNYDIGQALSGGYGEDVKFEFCLGWQGKSLIACGAVLKSSDEVFAILGPFGVKGDMRGQGLGKKLLKHILEKLKADGVKSIYLGVRQDASAAKFYRKMGFESLGGVVMRKSFDKDFEDKYFKASGRCFVRDAEWSDWAGVQIAMARNGELEKFAGLFYDMKIQAEKEGKSFKVLCDGTKILGVRGIF